MQRAEATFNAAGATILAVASALEYVRPQLLPRTWERGGLAWTDDVLLVAGWLWEAVIRRDVELLRELFGNPFRAVTLAPSVLVWGDSTVRRIAQGIYDERAFGRLPILADALLDAGCDDEELMAHCRSARQHLHGCWAVDLILGRQ